jgi:hypothetical protein
MNRFDFESVFFSIYSLIFYLSYGLIPPVEKKEYWAMKKESKMKEIQFKSIVNRKLEILCL